MLIRAGSSSLFLGGGGDISEGGESVDLLAELLPGGYFLGNLLRRSGLEGALAGVLFSRCAAEGSGAVDLSAEAMPGGYFPGKLPCRSEGASAGVRVSRCVAEGAGIPLSGKLLSPGMYPTFVGVFLCLFLAGEVARYSS